MAKTDLTAQRLREVLHYDPQTGLFNWRARAQEEFRSFRAFRAFEARFIGRQAGATWKDGRIVVRVDGDLHYAHRLAWMHVYGRWPERVIDHINGNPADNRIANLRDVTLMVNGQNLRKQRAGKVEPLGAYLFNKKLKKPYTAKIRVNDRSVHLGYFKTAEEAHAAYVQEKRINHEGCTI